MVRFRFGTAPQPGPAEAGGVSPVLSPPQKGMQTPWDECLEGGMRLYSSPVTKDVQVLSAQVSSMNIHEIYADHLPGHQ